MIRCYRGVAKDNLHYKDAIQGITRPIGGLATPTEHNDGDTSSVYTSWTTNRQAAREKALDSELGGQGVVLQKDFDPAQLVASSDAFHEGEVLVRGVVTGALVTEVS